MVDLFADIPEEIVENTLRSIRANLDKVDLYGGHTLRKHSDIQVQALWCRLTREDIDYATSFWDMEVAVTVAQEMMRQCFDDEISFWLRNCWSDSLSLVKHFQKTIGYGFKKGEDMLQENLKKARLVLIKDKSADWGFRILTSYPLF
ncbi:RNase A-like domain-containing protein [Parablautia sp. Marseille-Q6255]|uniref:RNase A-like domain-containing protein n=1 Tax=Parablautia sp. Marseille-Q6255 TaxID=3039593 RepID=UPI0024BCAE4C|nr:RNase A-like domain-containing protein [Parablautia sp. Marseille-Q6255]